MVFPPAVPVFRKTAWPVRGQTDRLSMSGSLYSTPRHSWRTQPISRLEVLIANKLLFANRCLFFFFICAIDTWLALLISHYSTAQSFLSNWKHKRRNAYLETLCKITYSYMTSTISILLPSIIYSQAVYSYCNLSLNYRFHNSTLFMRYRHITFWEIVIQFSIELHIICNTFF